jgi:site-specific recombinase XerD
MTTEKAQKEKRGQQPKWPQIRKRTYPNGTIAWLVDGRICGKGERFSFGTKQAATTKADNLRTERRNSGTAALGLPEKVRIEALDCLERLEAVGATLTDAVDYYLLHAKPAGGDKTVEKMIADFIHAKRQAGRKESYLGIQKCVLDNFAKVFGKIPVHTIGHAAISEWIQNQIGPKGTAWTLRTRENVKRDLGNFFGFAMKHGHCAINPVLKLERATLDDHPPGILTVVQASALLVAADSIKDGVMLPFVAIGLFAGLRTSELKSLDWAQVNLRQKTVEVLARNSKTRARRIVSMSDGLKAWLAPYAKVSGPVTPHANPFELLRVIHKAAEITKWPKNALRHSFASYHVAKHKDAPRTSLELGHDNPNQLFQSYRELVKPVDARKYWSLKPKRKPGNILAFTKKAA